MHGLSPFCNTSRNHAAVVSLPKLGATIYDTIKLGAGHVASLRFEHMHYRICSGKGYYICGENQMGENQMGENHSTWHSIAFMPRLLIVSVQRWHVAHGSQTSVHPVLPPNGCLW